MIQNPVHRLLLTIETQDRRVVTVEVAISESLGPDLSCEKMVDAVREFYESRGLRVLCMKSVDTLAVEL